MVAKELAETGHAVVLLEEGDYITRADFTGHAAEMQRKLYRDMGATLSIGNAVIPIPLGHTVGGTTTINSGTCYRTPDRVLRDWVRELGLAELAPEHMAPYFERVEADARRRAGRRRSISAAWRASSRAAATRSATRTTRSRRNAPECDGQGVCCFGCPTDAKRSTNVTYVPLALKAGASCSPACAPSASSSRAGAPSAWWRTGACPTAAGAR